jgi:hypothetical protein
MIERGIATLISCIVSTMLHFGRRIGILAQATEIEQFVEQCRELYRDMLCGPTKRIERGEILFKQFEEEAAALIAKPSGDDRALAERVNEMAVAKILADDPTITGKITYEPNILPSGRKIDFVVEREKDNLYVEVKTVHPRKADTEAAWQLYLDRRPNHQPNAEFHVEKEWMGGAIYGNTFASRSRFLEYALDFEVRLAEAKKVKPGPGILVFCGTGFPWHLSNLEDFADFYLVGTHRQDDPFALMELHHIEHEKLSLLRNIDHFAFVRRATEQAKITSFVWPVRGPKFGGPIAPSKPQS